MEMGGVILPRPCLSLEPSEVMRDGYKTLDNQRDSKEDIKNSRINHDDDTEYQHDNTQD